MSQDSDKYKKLKELIDKKALAHLATIHGNSPHLIPLWIDFDGENLLINTLIGTQKDKNMQKHSTVAISIVDPENPYSSVLIEGKAISREIENAKEHYSKVSHHYTGSAYKGPKGDRVIYKIRPVKIIDVLRE